MAETTKTPAVPREFLDFINSGNKFIVAGHKEPDGDCVGSQLALALVLRRMGKEAIACSAGPFKRLEIKPYECLFTPINDSTDLTGFRLIITDCSAQDRLGDIEPLLKALPIMAVDHHDNAAFPTTLCGYIDPGAYSTTCLIYNTIIALGLQPVKDEAELLFLGLCTDTGFFRHVDTSGAEAFRIASDLIRCGANPKAAFAVMNGGKSLNSRKLLGQVMLRAESLFDGKLILSWEEYEETQIYGQEGRDSDMMYQLFQSVAGVEAIVMIRQESAENCSIGFRSRDQVDVGSIAQSFGGGGHKNAAGLYVAGSIAELKPKIISAFENQFQNPS